MTIVRPDTSLHLLSVGVGRYTKELRRLGWHLKGWNGVAELAVAIKVIATMHRINLGLSSSSLLSDIVRACQNTGLANAVAMLTCSINWQNV